MKFELRLLGAPVVLVDSGPPPADLEWKKHKALLIYLACSGDRGRGRDHLRELLWPSGNTAQSLNQALVHIRKIVGTSGLIGDGESIRLAPGSVSLDLMEFQQLAEEKDWPRAAALIRGQFCDGLFIEGTNRFDDWLALQRREWRERCIRILIRYGEAILDGGNAAGAIVQLRRALDLDPLHEPAHRGLLRALVLDDQRSVALEEHRDFGQRLKEELGATVSPEITQLVNRLKRWAPARKEPTAEGESRRVPLIGRSRELASLSQLWSESRAQQRSALGLIVGNGGSGKSRLAQELASRTRLDGAVVASVRLVPTDRETPQGALIGLARGGLLDASGLAAVAPPALATMGRHIPEWAERYPPSVSSTLSLSEALGQICRTVSEEQPVLILLDDAHWADRASLEGIETLIRDHPHIPLSVIIATESHPAPEGLDRLRARIGRDLPGVTVALEPFSLDEIEEMSRWFLPSLSDDQLARVARRVLADSAGLPFLALELLNAVRLGLDLGRVNGAWPAPFRTLTHTLPGDLPDSVVAALRVGYRRVSEAAQQALQVIATIEDRLATEALIRITDLAASVVVEALDELEWQHWLNADARGFSFVARIAREVIARDMTTSGQRERILARWKSIR